jgi:hypothetical protein
MSRFILSLILVAAHEARKIPWPDRVEEWVSFFTTVDLALIQAGFLPSWGLAGSGVPATTLREAPPGWQPHDSAGLSLPRARERGGEA